MASANTSSSEDEDMKSTTEIELNPKSGSIIGKTYGKRRDEDTESVTSLMFSSATVDPEAAKELEYAITIYLRRATENFDLTKNVEVIF